MQPATNNGVLKEHSTECTYAFKGMAQTLALPIYQNETSALPDPMSIYLSFN
jgi:hypothetical protein